jgi:hypothetical protein
MTGAVGEILHEARAAAPKTKGPIADEVRSEIVELGHAIQTLQGHSMLLVTEGNQLTIAPGGFGAWLATRKPDGRTTISKRHAYKPPSAVSPYVDDVGPRRRQDVAVVVIAVPERRGGRALRGR